MSFNPANCRNETEVESKLVVHYLLPTLGYSPETWNQEVSFGSIRLDFLVFAAQIMPINVGENSPLSLVIEAKAPQQNLNPYVSKLQHYLTCLRVPYGVLTNSKDFRIYERVNQNLELIFRCSGTEIEAQLPIIKSLIGREEIWQKKFGRKSSPKSSDPEKNRTIENSDLTSSEEESQNKPTFTASKFSNANHSIPQNFQSPQTIVKTNSISETLGEPQMKTIAVYHNKGGVGKTTTVVNLAAALSKEGKRVLVVDLDSQANTTFATGLVKFDDEVNDTLKECNVLHLLSSEEFYPIKEVARRSNFSNPPVDVIPSHIELMKAEDDLNRLDYSRMILIQKLREAEQDYDIVIIDTPPSLNLYARVAIIAADYLIIPSDLKPFANQGLKNVKALIKEIDGFRKILGKPPVKILGVLASKVSTNIKFVEHALPKRMQTVEERYELEVMESTIYEREALAKCSEQTQIVGGIEISDPSSVLDFQPDSQSAQEFKDLALEVLRKIG
jgi:cellulose biosynthesis protein BcsQ